MGKKCRWSKNAQKGPKSIKNKEIWSFSGLIKLNLIFIHQPHRQWTNIVHFFPSSTPPAVIPGWWSASQIWQQNISLHLASILLYLASHESVMTASSSSVCPSASVKHSAGGGGGGGGQYSVQPDGRSASGVQGQAPVQDTV